jgi:hypothetical protein
MHTSVHRRVGIQWDYVLASSRGVRYLFAYGGSGKPAVWLGFSLDRAVDMEGDTGSTPLGRLPSHAENPDQRTALPRTDSGVAGGVLGRFSRIYPRGRAPSMILLGIGNSIAGGRRLAFRQCCNSGNALSFTAGLIAGELWGATL